MKLCLLYPFLFFFLYSCHPNNLNKKKPFDPKAFMDSLPEPLLSKIPDSMKKWLPILENVRKNDQKFRSISDPSLLEKNITEQKILDEANQKIIVDFIDHYGYPNQYQIGIKGMMAVNLVIQHSPLNMQEKYYWYMAEAYKKGNVSGETFALLEDRINARNNRKQFYGTQLVMYKNKYTPYPLANIDSLYIYRKRMNLPWTMEYYLKTFKSEWDSTKYKETLPALIKYLRTTDSTSLHFTK